MQPRSFPAALRRASGLFVAISLGLALVPTTQAAAAPAAHRVALGWGYDNSGQLGNGGTARVKSPSLITFPTSFTSVVIGRDHTVAIDKNGGLWAWGRNDRGQLGDGTKVSRLRPVRVKLTKKVRVTQVAVADDHALALTTTGRVYTWGANSYGQLGNGSRRDRHTPVRVHIGRVSKVGAGRQTSYAALRHGGLRAWGHNRHGQLGDGSRHDRHRPVHVARLGHTKIAAVDAGDATAVALTTEGRVLAWGDNRSGMVGARGHSDRRRPVTVRLPHKAKARSVSAGARFAVAIDTHGHVVTWGGATGAELGRNGSGAARPGNVSLGQRVRQISAGGSHVLALTDHGQVWVWGENNTHQLGIASDVALATPRQLMVPPSQHIAMVSAGTFTSYAVTKVKTQRPRLRITPVRTSVSANTPVAYTVARVDSVGTTEEPDAQVTIDQGTCRAETCQASAVGRHVVAVRLHGLHTTAVLNVVAPSRPGSTPASTIPTGQGSGSPAVSPVRAQRASVLLSFAENLAHPGAAAPQPVVAALACLAGPVGVLVLLLSHL